MTAKLTIADIARETGVAESTLRFYRDKFSHYIPSVGEGRKRRYEPQAGVIFEEIASLSSQGVPIAEIEQYLSERYPHNPDEVLTAVKPQSAVIATQPQEEEISTITVNQETATTAMIPQPAINAVTAIEPQYILSFMELLKNQQQKEPEKIYCTVKEAALRTGLSQRFIKVCCRDYLVTRSGLPCTKTGRGYVIHKELLDEWFTKVITLGYGS